MAVKIRLTRMGAKNKPIYRIVVSDSRSPRDGKYIESVGTYNPNTEPATVKVDKDAAKRWLNNGAIPTDTVRSLLSKAGVMKEFAEEKTKKGN